MASSAIHASATDAESSWLVPVTVYTFPRDRSIGTDACGRYALPRVIQCALARTDGAIAADDTRASASA
jgi:hypothetical protein